MITIAAPLLLVVALTQSTPPGEGTIAGRVVDGVTDKPVGAVVVSLSGAGMTTNPLPNRPPRILTGADGRFVFRGLAVPGSFAVSATRNGYADGAPGRLRPGGGSETIDLVPGAPAADIVVRVWKNGVIAGTITDEAG